MFSFGNPNPNTPKTATGFTLPTSNTATTTAGGFQLNLGAGDNKTAQNKPSTTLFAAPQPTAAKTTAPGMVLPTFGATTVASTTSTSAAPPAFGLGSSAAASSTTFTPIVGTSAPSTGGLLFTGAPAQSTAPKFPTITSTAPTLTLGGATSTAGPAVSTAAASTTVSIPTGALTFGQLEDSINKWTIDLEEQGKFFINQAKQLNAWDSLLISNGEKILNLNGSIERVKQQQTQLDQELDFVLAQQKELEELIAPLEKDLMDIPVTDIDRNQMYQMSEMIDSQLKQMSDDLKEIIEHINESHKDEESSNPITQISRILNAHMNSLQWIDTNTAQISSHLEQINKMQDLNRRNMSLNNSFKGF